MGVFDNMANVRFAGRDPFFVPEAEFLVEVNAVECYESKNPTHKGATFFKIRARVLAVAFDAKEYNPETFQSTQMAGEENKVLRPSQYGTQLINLAHGEPALGDVKAFATVAYRAKARLAGHNPDEIVKPDQFSSVDYEALFSPEQPCAGLTLGLRTQRKTTLKGQPFTQHYWEEAASFRFSFPERARIDVVANPEPSAESSAEEHVPPLK